MGRPRYWITKENILWRKLTKKLNSASEHNIKDVRKVCEYWVNADTEQNGVFYTNRTYGSYLRNLQRYGFIDFKKSVNQNGNVTEKIIVKRKIGKKVTPELFDNFLKHPWLSWFMYPE